MAAAVGFPSRDLVSIGEMVGLAFPALSVAAVESPLLGSTRALPHSAVVAAVALRLILSPATKFLLAEVLAVLWVPLATLVLVLLLAAALWVPLVVLAVPLRLLVRAVPLRLVLAGLLLRALVVVLGLVQVLNCCSYWSNR